MTFIRTLLRDIAPEELEITSSHEHLVCRPPYWVEKGEDDLILDDPEKSLQDVLDFKAAGGTAIVDATCIDYGRDISAVAEIAKKSGIHIIATAGLNKGFLWSAKMPGTGKTFAEWIDQTSEEDLAKLFIAEVEDGIEGTGYRAGQIKFGTGYNSISALEEKVLRAVAKAHLATGAPLHAHTESGTMALEQAELLLQMGVNLARVSFGHMDRNPDPYIHRKLAEKGAFLCFDGLGKVKYYPESTRIACILELVRRGHEDQILLGCDTARKSYFRSYGYGLGLDWMLWKWVPRFIEEATEASFDGKRLVEKFLIENPRRYLAFGEAEP
ncbi:MAG: phosphotriesterase [Chloroflexi bacterium]|nr:phosphotriesterase [Chloroflexota bacterium]